MKPTYDSHVFFIYFIFSLNQWCYATSICTKIVFRRTCISIITQFYYVKLTWLYLLLLLLIKYSLREGYEFSIAFILCLLKDTFTEEKIIIQYIMWGGSTLCFYTLVI